MNTQHPESLGPFEIDPVAAELRKAGRRVPLEPLPVKILHHLAQSRGRLVTRHELRELGWPKLPGAAQNSLNTCIHQIRVALNADGDSRVELETLRGRGYRLSVIEGPEEGRHPGPRGWQVPRARAWGIGVMAAALVAVAASLEVGRAPDEVAQAVERAHYLALETGDYAAAKAVLDSVRTTHPNVGLPHGEWAELSLRTGDLEGAREAAQRALALDRNLGVAHRVLGGIAMTEGDWNTAEALLRQGASLGPDDPRSHTGLAFFALVRGDFAQAEAHLRDALAADPLSASVHQSAGYMFLLMGRLQDATRYCEEALRFKPRSPWALECLFDAHVLLGEHEEAAPWGIRLAALYGGVAPQGGPETQVSWVQTFRLDRWMNAVDNGAHPLGLARALAINDKPDQAMEILAAALEAPSTSLLTVAVDPRMQGLRQEPGFEQVRHTLGLSR